MSLESKMGGLAVYLIIATAFSIYIGTGACEGGGWISLDFSPLCFTGIWAGFILASGIFLIATRKRKGNLFTIFIVSLILGGIGAPLTFVLLLMLSGFLMTGSF